MEKLFYDRNGKIQKIKTEMLLKKGMDTSTYKTVNGECLKVFTLPCADEDMFQVLSKITMAGFYQITELLYNEKSEFIAYKTKFYPEEEIDILTMPVDYTIANMRRLYKVSDVLSANGVTIEDLHHKNVILTSSDMIIIDADRYTYNPNTNPQELNRRFINTLFVLLYMTSPSINYLSSSQGYYAISETIRKLFIRDNTPDIVHKKLVRHKYPIDYLKKNI